MNIQTIAFGLFFFFTLTLSAQPAYDAQWVFGYGNNLPQGFGLGLLSFQDQRVRIAPYGA